MTRLSQKKGKASAKTCNLEAVRCWWFESYCTAQRTILVNLLFSRGNCYSVPEIRSARPPPHPNATPSLSESYRHMDVP